MNNVEYSSQELKIINEVDKKNITKLLNSKKVFNPVFYSKHYIGKPVSPIYAAAHYLTYAKYDDRNPSINFFSSNYFKKNINLKQTRMGAGEHYLKEHKKPFISSVPKVTSDSILIKTLDLEFPKVKIAIIIHIFYPDYNEILAKILSFYTFEFTLFITSPQQNIIDDLISQLKIHNINGPIKIAKTPNRGRNFAPFLVEFGKELRDYDLIAHVHSKKSLHHSQARWDWGLSCITGVLGSSEYVLFVINELSKNNQYGLVSSERYAPAVPYFGYHWLKNFSMAKQLAKQLELSIEEGFVNYPIGGMFWARREAISNILDKDWTYEDFPEEGGQLDGTTQHSLERLIGVNCQQKGFKLLKWEVDKGIFNNNNSPGVGAFKQISKKSIQDKIQEADVIAFDIFDTLLYRNVFDPSDIRNSLNRAGLNYRLNRFKAESIARGSLSINTDVKIADIVIKLSKLLSISLSDAFALISQEFNYDLLSMKPRCPVINLVKQAKFFGKRVIYISDMYYGENEILIILNHLNIPIPDKLYISSIVGVRKDTGAMWKYVKQEEKGILLHLGDNMVSDIQNAIDCGINAEFIPSIQEKAKMLNIFHRQPANAQEWHLIFPLIEHFGKEPFFC